MVPTILQQLRSPSRRLIRRLLLGSAVLLLACSPQTKVDGPADSLAETPGEEAESLNCPAELASISWGAGTRSGIAIGGQQRSFELLLPEVASPADGHPLLLAFHGTGENGPRFVQRAQLADFVAQGFVVIAPDAAGNGTLWPVWDAMRLPGDDAPNLDLLYFDALLACALQELPVDPSRVYVAGHSAGGIMTNALLQQRGEWLAGGIVGSGVFELTSGGRPAPARPMNVIVTWGGANDVYTGATSDGTTVSSFHFEEQAVLASRFYAERENVRHFHCRGQERGHAWLRELNDWMATILLGGDEPQPASTLDQATCSAAAAHFAQPEYPECDGAGACSLACENISLCLAGNQTVGPTLAPLLRAFGLIENCQGCMDGCADRYAQEEDVVSCIAQPVDCGPGIEGAMPFLARVQECCSLQQGSTFCTQFCDSIDPSSSSIHFLPFCQR